MKKEGKILRGGGTKNPRLSFLATNQDRPGWGYERNVQTTGAQGTKETFTQACEKVNTLRSS